MEAANIHISAYCSISDNKVSKNGQAVFATDHNDAQAFLVDVYRHFALNYARFYKMDSLSKLGWLATEILLKDTFIKDNYRPEDVGMVLMNANASLDSDQKYIASVADIASPALFVYTLPNIMMGEISIRNNFKGEAAFFVTQSFDANFTQQYIADLFNNDIFKACICGWAELVGNEYKAVLFLVEKGQGPMSFTADQMNKLFN